MTAKNIATYSDLIREYKQKFGKEPNITGREWFSDPTELIVEALETGVPINQRPVPSGMDT